jgi:SOS-response transcriptional repressor LexA
MPNDPLHFEIRISDWSLRDVGIPKGSCVNFRRSVTFWNGDLIAARPPRGLVVVHAYHVEGGRVRLDGAHPRCPVRTYLRRDVKVLGIAHPVTKESEPVVEGDGLDWPEYICIGGAA